MSRRLRLAVALLVAVLVPWAACKKRSPDDRLGTTTAAPAPADAVEVVVAYGSEKKTWLEEQARAFAGSGARTRSGHAVRVTGKPMGSGEVTQAILAGSLRPTVFSPASGAYVTLLNQAWMSTAGHTRALSPAGEPLVLSPIVIAMWKPMAEALGWPGKRIAWADLLKVNADPRGWGALGHPEWGRFKLGHTHPEYSNSGLLAVLAEAYAGAGKTRGLTVDDLAAAATRAFLVKVESTIVHYGKSTGFFADKMLERGPKYLSAAILYENVVIESYAKARGEHPPLVAIYPVEGTFWSDHPYAILDADWVTAEQREGAELFLAFLKARPAQQRALELGFRPGDPAIATSAPIDAAHGVDATQPQTLLEVPDGPTLAALLDAWRQTKKATDVVLVFDTSGSMQGNPLIEAKAGAKAFLDTLHDADEVTILFFDSAVRPAHGPYKLGDKKVELVRLIDGAVADGKTALYDAVAQAHTLAGARLRAEPGRIHAVVVMTDGADQGSKTHDLGSLQRLFAAGDDAVRVFTISYGQQTDARVLATIAEAGHGATASGSVDTIVSVFADMGSFF